MPTRKIMLIRHAERPNGEPGEPDSESLTATGWRRADKLATFFNPGAGLIEKPQHLFASGPNVAEQSLRPIQTLTPLSRSLPSPIDTTSSRGEEETLVTEAKAIGDVVLIAWQHERIPAIASLILGDPERVPEHWKHRRFDLVWVFERQPGDDAWSFVQVPQLLMPGDSDQPIQ